MSEQLTISIDGRQCACNKGEYLLEVAKRNGVFIPTLCHHEGLESLGACRVCIVEVVERGKSRVVASCIFPVEREIEVFTRSEKIIEQRGVIVTLLARLAPDSQKVAALARGMGFDMPRLSAKAEGGACILCGRCVTACEAFGCGAIAKINRGVAKEIAAPYKSAPVECIGCGSCAHVCPTDAIPFEQGDGTFTIWGRVFELLRCPDCGKPVETREQHEFLRSRDASGGLAPIMGTADAPLCDECQKKAVAKKLALVDGRYGSVTVAPQ
jgi:formate hydrogenlyase subunit 6/NADH:ubiquinone oxidoreductase subunit I/ferredoxin